MILLGEKTLWWKLKVILFFPVWLLHDSPKKKSWKEFKYGLITHKCDFDRSKPDVHEYGTYWDCRHYGCNMCTTLTEDGKLSRGYLN